MNTQSVLLLLALSLPILAVDAATEELTDEDISATQFLEYGYDRLKRFSVAYMLVYDLQDQYDPQFRKLKPNSTEYKTLLKQSDEEMTRAIESTGLSLESYNAFADAIATDNKLADEVTRMVRKLREDQISLESTDDEDMVDLGTMEVQGFQITKSLIDAEIEVALKRPISTDPDDDYLLICRDSSTGTRIKQRWCAYNVDLARPMRQDQILTIDPFVARWRWERFYNRLPD